MIQVITTITPKANPKHSPTPRPRSVDFLNYWNPTSATTRVVFKIRMGQTVCSLLIWHPRWHLRAWYCKTKFFTKMSSHKLIRPLDTGQKNLASCDTSRSISSRTFSNVCAGRNRKLDHFDSKLWGRIWIITTDTSLSLILEDYLTRVIRVTRGNF